MKITKIVGAKTPKKKGIPAPKAKWYKLPISESLRKRLTRKSDIYDYSNQIHSTNLSIIEGVLEGMERNRENIEEFVSVEQNAKGITLVFDGEYLFTTITIEMKANGIRRYQILGTFNQVLFDKTFKSSLTQKFEA